MWEAEGSGGGAGAREEPERELAHGSESAAVRAALRALRRQVLEALSALSLSAQRRSTDARLSAGGQRALAEAERSLRALVAELVRDARWPGSVRDARIVLGMIEVGQRELSALRTAGGDGGRATALFAELAAALRRAFLSDQEVGMG